MERKGAEQLQRGSGWEDGRERGCRSSSSVGHWPGTKGGKHYGLSTLNCARYSRHQFLTLKQTLDPRP
eukprot:1656793-Rhodomonas_salina.2